MDSDQNTSAANSFSYSRVFMVSLFAIIGLTLFVWAFSEHDWLNETTASLANRTYLPDKHDGDTPDAARIAQKHYGSHIGPVIFRYVMAILFILMAIGTMVSNFGTTSTRKTRFRHDVPMR